MSGDVETVLGRLTADSPKARPIYAMLFDDSEVQADDLQFTDWTRPLQISDGRVCLRWSMGEGTQDYYLGWIDDEFVALHEASGSLERKGPALYWFEEDFEHPAFECEPVLREDTLFDVEGAMRCPECDREHGLWFDDGTHAVNGPHHAGIIERWECGHCGHVLECGRR